MSHRSSCCQQSPGLARQAGAPRLGDSGPCPHSGNLPVGTACLWSGLSSRGQHSLRSRLHSSLPHPHPTLLQAFQQEMPATAWPTRTSQPHKTIQPHQTILPLFTVRTIAPAVRSACQPHPPSRKLLHILQDSNISCSLKTAPQSVYATALSLPTRSQWEDPPAPQHVL